MADLDLADLDLADLDLANLDHDDRGVLTHLEAHHGTSVTTRNRPLGGLPGAAPQRRAAPHEHPP